MMGAMSEPTVLPVAPDAAYGPDLEVESELWTEIVALCRGLTPDQRLRPGYYRDPDWTVKDMLAHLGTWMAEAEIQLLRIESGTYVEEPLDIDALNAEFLAALRDQDWSTVWTQAISGRAQMYAVFARIRERSAPADWWVRKAGAEHESEHLPRLREWVAELASGAQARAGA
jgi:hypothetical protein